MIQKPPRQTQAKRGLWKSPYTIPSQTKYMRSDASLLRVLRSERWQRTTSPSKPYEDCRNSVRRKFSNMPKNVWRQKYSSRIMRHMIRKFYTTKVSRWLVLLTPYGLPNISARVTSRKVTAYNTCDTSTSSMSLRTTMRPWWLRKVHRILRYTIPWCCGGCIPSYIARHRSCTRGKILMK